MTLGKGWEGILDKGEHILWQGRPDPGFRLRLGYIVSGIFGLFFAAFALFWMVMAASAGGFFWMFGLLHFSVGLGIAVGPIAYDILRRRNTWYTLSDRRAFIATDLPLVGRRLQSWPITSSTVLELQDNDPPSIYFAEEFKRTKNGHRRVPIGFEAIADAPEVLKLMREIQTGAA